MNKITLGIIFIIAGLASMIAQDLVKCLSEVVLGLLAFIMGCYILATTRKFMNDKNFQMAVTIRGVLNIIFGLGCAITVLVFLCRYGFAKGASDAGTVITEQSRLAAESNLAGKLPAPETLDSLKIARDSCALIVGYILSGLFGVSALLEAYYTFKLFKNGTKIWFPVVEVLICVGVSVIFSLQEFLPEIFRICGIIIAVFGIVFIATGIADRKNKQQPQETADNVRVEDLKEAEKV